MTSKASKTPRIKRNFRLIRRNSGDEIA
jgi:hypothetical protein